MNFRENVASKEKGAWISKPLQYTSTYTRSSSSEDDEDDNNTNERCQKKKNTDSGFCIEENCKAGE